MLDVLIAVYGIPVLIYVILRDMHRRSASEMHIKKDRADFTSIGLPYDDEFDLERRLKDGSLREEIFNEVGDQLEELYGSDWRNLIPSPRYVKSSHFARRKPLNAAMCLYASKRGKIVLSQMTYNTSPNFYEFDKRYWALLSKNLQEADNSIRVVYTELDSSLSVMSHMGQFKPTRFGIQDKKKDRLFP